MSRRHLKILLILAGAGAYFLAGAVHELGHAAAVLLLGGKIYSIQPFAFLGPPHLTYSTGFSPGQLAIVHIAAMAAVTLTGLAGLAVIPWGRLSRPWGLALGIFEIAFLSQMLVWIVLPLGELAGWHTADDCAKFLAASGARPGLVAGSALAASALAWTLFLKRSGFIGLLRTKS